MYDTTEKLELASLIEKFWNKMDLIKFTHLKPRPESPSNKANIWGHLFPIHPLSSTDPLSAERVGDFYDDGTCSNCIEEFADAPGRVLARLHCDHWFHFTCIRDWFDRPNHLSSRCMKCQRDWRLHEHTGITPETRALDVWDYEELMGWGNIQGSSSRAPEPDLTQDYIDEDQRMANASLRWTELNGYAAAGIRARAPATEMATYRKIRRNRNELRRAALQAARKGFYGLDPDIADQLQN